MYSGSVSLKAKPRPDSAIKQESPHTREVYISTLKRARLQLFQIGLSDLKNRTSYLSFNVAKCTLSAMLKCIFSDV